MSLDVTTWRPDLGNVSKLDCPTLVSQPPSYMSRLIWVELVQGKRLDAVLAALYLPNAPAVLRFTHT
jgi:hypothetical protein